MHRTGLTAAQVFYDRVPDYQRALATGLHGSPTIRVNGRDPFSSADEPASLSWRLYATQTGSRAHPRSISASSR